MPRWVRYSVLSIVLYGLWGVVLAAASNALNPLLVLLLSTLGLMPVALAFVLSKNLTAGKRLRRGIAWAFVTGLLGSGGTWTLSEALKRGEASTVVPFISPYPLVAVILAMIFLRERPNRIQLAGVVLALGALVLLSVTPGEPGKPAAGFSLFSAWVAYALLTLLLFGASGLTQKLATNDVSTEMSMVAYTLAYVPVGAAILATQSLDWASLSGKGTLLVPVPAWILAVASGVLFGLAVLAQFVAYRWGTAALVTALTSLGTAATVVIAVPVFGDSLDARKIAGILLALAAGVALSFEGRAPEAVEIRPAALRPEAPVPARRP
jgi:transporter family protein